MSNSPTFFRRVAPAVLVGTAAVAVVGLFDPALGGQSDAAPLASAPLTPSQGSARSGGSNAAGGSTAGGSTSGTSGSGGSTQSQGAQSQGAQGGGTQSQGTSGSGGGSCDNAQEVVGDSINTRWGPVQVAALVAGGQLCQVYAVDAPHNDGHSASITRQVIPYLDQQATQMGISFDGVSGATYTSEGYRQSLQTIVDQL